jgi:hypothetical protein
MTKYKVSKELPYNKKYIDYDKIYIKPNYDYGEYNKSYDKSTDIVKFCKKDGSLWTIFRTGKFLTFRHKHATISKESFIEILSSCYPEDYEFFIWHPEAINGEWNQ